LARAEHSALGTRALVEALSKQVDSRASREEELEGIKARAKEAIQAVQPQMDYLNVIREVLPRDGFFVNETGSHL